MGNPHHAQRGHYGRNVVLSRQVTGILDMLAGGQPLDVVEDQYQLERGTLDSWWHVQEAWAKRAASMAPVCGGPVREPVRGLRRKT